MLQAGKEPTLEELQAWFGRAISRPLPSHYHGNPLDTSAPGLREAGEALVAGPGGFSGFDRVGVYNEQYWFRLLTIMQGEYPCAVHLMGLRAFNDRAMAYLEAHPPSSPFLARLDEAWPDFLFREYREKNRDEVLQGAAVDRAFSRAVDAPGGLPLDPDDATAPRLVLASHAAVLRLDWDFSAFRAACLADESLEQAIPLEPQSTSLAIWRGTDDKVWQQTLGSAASKVLRTFRDPQTVAEAFELLEGALKPEEESDLEAHLPEWFAGWTRDGVLARAP